MRTGGQNLATIAHCNRRQTLNVRRTHMPCERCGGLMIAESPCDVTDVESPTRSVTTRCLNCGNIDDAVIRANRSASHLPKFGERHFAGARGPRMIQPSRLERVMPMEGVIADCPRDRAPRSPGGAPSTKPQTFESAHSEPLNSVLLPHTRCA